MAVRKIENDEGARDAAIELISENLGVLPEAERDAETMTLAVIGLFDGAQFETSQAKIAGEVRDVQRIVLTTDWQFVY